MSKLSSGRIWAVADACVEWVLDGGELGAGQGLADFGAGTTGEGARGYKPGGGRQGSDRIGWRCSCVFSYHWRPWGSWVNEKSVPCRGRSLAESEPIIELVFGMCQWGWCHVGGRFWHEVGLMGDVVVGSEDRGGEASRPWPTC